LTKNPRTTILTRLPVPHLGTTSPINDHPPPCLANDDTLSTLPCCSTEQRSPAASLRTARRLLHPAASPSDGRLPRGASRVASPGQAWLQILNLALIPIVGIRPRIDHIKLDEHTHAKKLVARGTYRALLFLFIPQFQICDTI
jgi:hypothetical protein